MGITQKIVEEIERTKFESLSPVALERIKMAIMDDVGIAFMAYQLLDKPLVAFAKSIGGVAESTIIGDGSRIPCALAAAVNAEMASDSNFNESGPGVHAFSAIAQTAIAVGERTEASGKDIITAIALGYELNGRFVTSLKGADPRFVYIPSLLAPHIRRHINLNATFCAAKLLGLTEKDTKHAIALAWMFIPPSEELIRKSVWYKEHFLWVCQIGIQAALLVQNGYGGPDEDVLDKEAEIYNLEGLTKSPGPYHYAMNELCLKPWVGSYGFIGGIGLVLDILREQRLTPEQIENITFRGSGHYLGPFRNVIQNQTPKDFFAAKNSIPWTFAMAALGYEPGYEWFTQERFQDPVCLDLARKVRVESSEKGYYENEVEIATKTGTYKKQIKIEDVLGRHRRPMNWDQIQSKFMRLVKPIVGEPQAREMVSIFRNLENVGDIRELTKYFSPHNP